MSDNPTTENQQPPVEKVKIKPLFSFPSSFSFILKKDFFFFGSIIPTYNNFFNFFMNLTLKNNKIEKPLWK